MKFSYEIRKSTHSKNYFYIVEAKEDKHGVTKDAISKALTKEELWDLSNKIKEAIQ